MNIINFMEKLLDRDIQFWIEEGRLRCKGPNEAFNPEINQQIRERKEEIFQFLQRSNDVADVKKEIAAVSRDQDLPLSFSQQRLWFLNQLEGKNATYNMPNAFHLKGELDCAVLEQALNEVVRRHESLRTNFESGGEEPVLVINNNPTCKISQVDLRDLSSEIRKERLNELIEKEISTPFDLNSDLMIRAKLFILDDREYTFLSTMHHIASDAWSTSVLAGELTTLYQAFLNGKESPLPELEIQYADYAHWQREWFQGDILKKHQDYWKQQLDGIPELHNLPLDAPRPKTQTYTGTRHLHLLGQKERESLNQLGKKHDVTLFMMLQAIFAMLLSRYSNETDIVMGTPVSSRPTKNLESLIGFFVNTLALRTDLSGNPSFITLLERVRKTILEAYEYQNLPFDQLVEELQPKRGLNYTPLFQVMFVLQNHEKGEIELPELNFSLIELETNTSKFDLTLNVLESEEGLYTSWEYNTNLFEADTIQRMAGHFERLLLAVIKNPNQPVSQLALFSDEEKEKILVDWNKTDREFPKEKPLHQLFEEQATKSPDAIALQWEQQTLTYKALNQKSNQLAHSLLELGIKPETIVGISMERSMEMIIAILGVLKTGAAYLPVDPEYPEARINHMLEDSGIKLLLTQTRLEERFTDKQVSLFAIDSDTNKKALLEYSTENIDTAELGLKPDSLAYVIYTSGSTGKPKGVLLPHQGLTNLALAQSKEFEVTADSRVLQFASFSFDAATSEWAMAFVTGARLCLIPKEVAQSTEVLTKTINDYGITHVTLPPVLLPLMDKKRLTGLTHLIVAGDKCSQELAQSWSEGRTFYNAYGPSESTVCTSILKYGGEATQQLSIGKPIDNIRVYILDSEQNPVPVGVPGELHVAGIGLAKGYLNRPELTDEKFIANPFEQGGKLYKTGDLVRWLPDGNIDFLGRIDHQVKIRGFRVELGEIESNIIRHDAVQDCVVLIREDQNSEKQLVAYLVTENEEKEAVINELRTNIAAELPDYMMPAFFVTLDAFPLSPNGKVDRKALPEPDFNIAETEIFEPESETEKLLLALWQEVLKRDQFGGKANFFENGGHSLLATRLIALVTQKLEMDVPLKALFENPELPAFAKVLEQIGEKGKTKVPTITPIENRDEIAVPLSFAQQRLWFLDCMEGPNSTYNIPSALNVKGTFNTVAFKQALNEVLKRHESLRTIYRDDNGNSVQEVLPATEVPFTIVDLTDHEEMEKREKAEALIVEESNRPFDLSKDLMLRGCLLQLNEQENILLLTMHHIASDGWSMGILIRELSKLYDVYSQGKEPSPEPLPIQYSDYALWQREWLQGAVLDEQLAYWSEKLAGIPEAHNLPLDRPRPAYQTFHGTRFRKTISKDVLDQLNQLSREHGATLFMTLHTAFSVLLAKYSNETDIVMGTPIANRTQANLAPMIGFFVNSLVLRTDLSDNPTFETLLKQVRQTDLEAYQYQHIPFEQLVERLQPKRSLNHSPLFQVMIDLQNNEELTVEFAGLEFDQIEQSAQIAKYDLTLSLEETEEGLFTSWEYNTDLFDPSTIERISEHFEVLLKGIVENPKQTVAQLPLLETWEQKLLLEWSGDGNQFSNTHCIHERFEQAVEKDPEAIAITFEQQTMSYGALNSAANQMAHLLIAKGIKPDDLVGICMERSPEMIIGILGILKAGGAYVPLDPNAPEDRLLHMITDSELKVLLTTDALRTRFAGSDSLELIVSDNGADRELLEEQKTENPNCKALGLTTDHMAYVIYTSGSTGKPKGVQVTHHNVTRLFESSQDDFMFDNRDVWTLFHSFAFDFSVWEIWGALIYGGRLVIVPWQISRSPQDFYALLQKEQVTVLNQTPSAFYPLMEIANDPESVELSLRYVIFGGEALELPKLAPWFADQKNGKTQLVNMYGITETTVHVTYRPIDKEDTKSRSSVIGKPLADLRLYIMNEEQQPVPIGVPGEICVGGAGVARGYLNRPELTEERFIQNPFQKEEKLYRSGDLAKFLPDGDIEYLGRIDTQVKIRGFRIELGEIESKLIQNESVRDCVVIADEDETNDKRLVAYLVTDAVDSENLAETLRNELRKELPEYMVPSVFMTLETLPLTNNGKINRNALPKAEVRAESGQEFHEPTNNLESQILKAWKETLNLERISIHDNFFDLGGHSLKIIKLRSELEKALNQKVAVTRLFEFPTIQQQAIHFGNGAAQNLLLSEKDIRNQLKKEPTGTTNQDDIAIIGIYGKYPGANSVDAFWENLKNGVESSREFTDEELREEGIDEATINAPNYVKSKVILENIELFDADFFGYNPKEAAVIDPQQRFLLEGGWSLLESAGYTPEKYEGWVGVFAGASFSNYFLENLVQNEELLSTLGVYPLLLGNDKDFLATKLSYHLGLKGPAVTVQTACSTSLVATHMAAESLRNRECDMAIVGAASIGSPKQEGYFYVESGIASPDGHCRPFDAKAGGTIGGNGVSMVLLKRLEEAKQDCDTMLAVIKGSAINNDGAQKVGYTAPGVQGQATVIINAMENANVDPETISYIEAHGTATQMGDPIEINALTQAFRRKTQQNGFCGVGSVKSNIGHLDAAAGLTGLIKTVLAMKHCQLPPTVHFQEPNPEIDFENSPFYVVDQLKPWSNTNGPKRAGISSFGIGGTNAHLILEEAPTVELEKTQAENVKTVLPISAKTETALTTAINNLKGHLTQNENLNLNDIAYTLQEGRKEFDYRQAIVANSSEEAIQKLEALTTGNSGKIASFADATGTVFLFPGQGAQYANMALALYRQQPAFQAVVDDCCDYLQPILNRDLRTVLFPELTDELTTEEAAKELEQTQTTQPALFVIEYALAKLWMDFGIEPVAMIGHSVGEYVAAVLAGVMTAKEAMRLLAIRGRLIQSLPSGSMIAVPKGKEELAELLNEKISLAAHNGKQLSVLSGTDEAIAAVQKELEQRQIGYQPLKTSHAFHSVMMDPILEAFEQELKTVNFQAPKRPYISNVTGTWITEEDLKDPTYWVKHLRGTVQFQTGVETLLEEKQRTFLEVGPGTTLSALVKQNLESAGRDSVINSLRHPKENADDSEIFQQALAKVWSMGVTVNWSQSRNGEPAKRISLPTYPFERKRYWVEPVERDSNRTEQYNIETRKAETEWLSAPAWQPLQPEKGKTEEQEQGVCLLLINDLPGSELLINGLIKKGLTVVPVRPADAFAKEEGTGGYTINPEQSDDYDRLLAELKASGEITRVIHGWSLTQEKRTVAENQKFGFFSLMLLTQAINRELAENPLRITVLTNGSQMVTSNERDLNPEQATILGLSRVIRQEHANLFCHSLDLEFPEVGKKQIKPLLGEIFREKPDLHTAIRGIKRWALRYETVQPEPAEEETLRQNGVYLITGGLGAVGMILAKELAERVHAKLILIGRSSFPERESWESLLENSETNEETRNRIEGLKEIEAAGAEVMIVQADVTDPESMGQMLEAAKQRFGAIHGVIHAAGSAELEPIQQKTVESANRQFTAKLEGTLLLDQLFENEALDFMLLCSSIASALAGVGRSDYSGANLFLDTFAQQKTVQEGKKVIAVNWPGWKTEPVDNSDVPNHLKQFFEEQERQGINPEEGTRIFQTVLGQDDYPQLIASPVDLNALLKREQDKAETANDKNRQAFERPENLESTYEAPVGEMEEGIVAIWQELLGIDQIGRNDNFFELGGHSLLATTFLTRVRKEHKLEITLQSFFEHSTPAKVAQNITTILKTLQDMETGQKEELAEDEIRMEF